MPKVRDSSGTMGTTNLPTFLSRTMVLSIRTNAMVVEISRSSEPLSCVSNALSAGISSGVALRLRAGSEPPMASVRERRYFISGESSGGR